MTSWEEAVLWLREQPDRQQMVRDAYFDDPLTEAAERYWNSNEWLAIREIIGTGPGNALDAGAGRGIASYALARDGFSVTALEPDPSSVVGANAIRTLSSEVGLLIKIEENLSERLPFSDGSFDIVFARAVLHHIADLQAAMCEFHRVLRPGGLLLAAREHVITSEVDLPEFLNSHPLHHRYGGENAHPLAVYQGAIISAGFALERTIGSLDSPINFGPQQLCEIHNRLAKQLVPIAALRPLARRILGITVVSKLVRHLGSSLDRRPGRHATFVARRPA
jgi:SAM-dependent methyltransferase